MTGVNSFRMSSLHFGVMNAPTVLYCTEWCKSQDTIQVWTHVNMFSLTSLHVITFHVWFYKYFCKYIHKYSYFKYSKWLSSTLTRLCTLRCPDFCTCLYLLNPLRPSGNYMNHMLWQSVMLHFVFIGFVSFSVQTAIISLNSVNQLIFVMVKCGVLFEVRTEFLNII
jgi:hypothetical protein